MLEATYIVSYGEQRAENANHPPTHLTIDISSRKKNVWQVDSLHQGTETSTLQKPQTTSKKMTLHGADKMRVTWRPSQNMNIPERLSTKLHRYPDKDAKHLHNATTTKKNSRVTVIFVVAIEAQFFPEVFLCLFSTNRRCPYGFPRCKAAFILHTPCEVARCSAHGF